MSAEHDSVAADSSTASSSSVGRNSLIMAMGTAASRVTGQIRTILLAAAIGTTGIAANAYQAGSMIPQSIFTLVSGGIFNAVLVPQIVRTLKEKDAQERLNRLVTFAVSILLAMTVLMAALTPLLTRLYVGSAPDMVGLTNAFTLWCMPQIFFYGLYTLLGQILAAKNHFGMYAWSSTGANVISCIGFVIFIVMFGKANDQPLSFWTQDKIALTAGMWTLGVAFQALVLFFPLFKLGFRFRPRFGLSGFGLRSMGPVALGSLGVVIVSELSGIVLTRVASAAPEQAHALHGADILNVAGNATYQNAFTLFILPYSLIAVSVATAMFPKISRAIADRNLDEARGDLTSALTNVGLLLFFFAAAMIVFPVPIIRALLPSVSMSETHLIAEVLIALSFGIPIAAAVLLVQRTFYAFEDGLHPFIASLVQYGLVTILMLVCRAVLQPEQWVLGIAVSVSVAYALALPVMLIMLRRKFGERLGLKSALITSAKGLIAAVVAGVVVALLNKPVTALFGAGSANADGYMSWFAALGICVVLTIVLAAVYVLMLWLLKTTEVTTALGTITARLTRRKVSPADRMTTASTRTEKLSITEPEHAMTQHLGDTLLNRYILLSKLCDKPGITAWTASDRKLSRDCQVTVISDSALAQKAQELVDGADENNENFGEVLHVEQEGDDLIVVTQLEDEARFANTLADAAGVADSAESSDDAAQAVSQAELATESQLPLAVDTVADSVVNDENEVESTRIMPLFDENGNPVMQSASSIQDGEGEQTESSESSDSAEAVPPSFLPSSDAHETADAAVDSAADAAGSKTSKMSDKVAQATASTKQASAVLVNTVKSAAMDTDAADLSGEKVLGKYTAKVVAIVAAAAALLLAGVLSLVGLHGSSNNTNVNNTGSNWPEVDMDKVPFGTKTSDKDSSKKDDTKSDENKSDENKTDDTKSEENKTDNTQSEENKTEENKSDENKTDETTKVTADREASKVPSPNYSNDTPVVFASSEFLTNPGGQSGYAYHLHFGEATDVYRLVVNASAAGGHATIRANTTGDPTQGEQVADFSFAEGGVSDIKFDKIVNTQDVILWIPSDGLPAGGIYLNSVQAY